MCVLSVMSWSAQPQHADPRLPFVLTGQQVGQHEIAKHLVGFTGSTLLRVISPLLLAPFGAAAAAGAALGCVYFLDTLRVPQEYAKLRWRGPSRHDIAQLGIYAAMACVGIGTFLGGAVALWQS